MEIKYNLVDGELNIECVVLEEGTVPILVSNALMGFLEIDVKNRVNSVWISSPTFDYHEEPMQYSTSNHQIVDLTGIVHVPSAVKQGISGADAYTCEAAGAYCTLSVASATVEPETVASATLSGATSSLISQLQSQFDPEKMKRRSLSLGLACRNLCSSFWQSLKGDEVPPESGPDQPFDPSDLLDPEVEEGVPSTNGYFTIWEMGCTSSYR